MKIILLLLLACSAVNFGESNILDSLACSGKVLAEASDCVDAMNKDVKMSERDQLRRTDEQVCMKWMNKCIQINVFNSLYVFRVVLIRVIMIHNLINHNVIITYDKLLYVNNLCVNNAMRSADSLTINLI